MKKTMLVIAISAALTLAGCATATQQDQREIEALQSQVDELQDALDAMRENEEESSPPETEAAEQTADASTPESTQSETPPPAQESPSYSKTVESYDIAALETAVEDIVEQIDSATATGQRETDGNTFRELHNQLEEVDRQVDHMDEVIEADLRSGALSRDDYRTLDSQLDALENRLDRAEDTLEFAFGMDD